MNQTETAIDQPRQRKSYCEMPEKSGKPQNLKIAAAQSNPNPSQRTQTQNQRRDPGKALVPVQPKQPAQSVQPVRLVNSEQNSRLYVFDNSISSGAKNAQNPRQSNNIQPYINANAKSVANVNVNGNGIKTTAVCLPPQKHVQAVKPPVKAVTAANINKNNYKNKTEETPRVSPVKKLAVKFRKLGLGTVDSYFNAYFFYYQWKSDKRTAAHKKNEYAKYIALLTLIAKIWGFIASALSIFNPLVTAAGYFAKPAAKFFAGFANPKTKARNIGILIKKTCGFAVSAGAVAAVALVIMNISSYNPVLELTFDGQKMGFVHSKETAGKIITVIENNVSSVTGENYEFSGKIEYKIVLVKDRPEESAYVSEIELYDVLYYSRHTQSTVTKAYGLYIDGSLVIAAESEDEIKIVLEEILEANTDSETGETVEFAHDIEIIEDNYAAWDIVSQDELKNLISYSAEAGENDFLAALMLNGLTGPADNSETVEIKDALTPLADGLFLASGRDSDDSDDSVNSGETAVGGSETAAMAVVSLLSMTSEPISGTIPRGFVGEFADAGSGDHSSVLSRMKKNSENLTPNSIHFKRIRTETYTITTDFETVYEESNQYYAGTQAIKTEGKKGESLVTADITYIGDEEISREILSVEVTKKPVTKVVYKGTKVKPTTAPTGNFIRPLRGSLSTRYSAGHRAIDIPAPYGTSIVAADGGTVIYAGSSGSYGYHVKIRHDNGFVTLYAHFSSISVSNGDQVYQGQEVGKCGSTGRSTGNHLHFEIIKNGVQVNPELYLP